MIQPTTGDVSAAAPLPIVTARDISVRVHPNCSESGEMKTPITGLKKTTAEKPETDATATITQP
jgi:hypothetical protein